MKITCIKSGGFLGQEQTCIIDTGELDETEKEAFNELIKESRRDEKMRDSYVYYFSFEEGNSEKEVIMEETLLEEKMMPFIRKVDNTLKRRH